MAVMTKKIRKQEMMAAGGAGHRHGSPATPDLPDSSRPRGAPKQGGVRFGQGSWWPVRKGVGMEEQRPQGAGGLYSVVRAWHG